MLKQTVLLKDRTYTVQMPKLLYDLVSVQDLESRTSQLLHPIDSMLLGIHNGGYFWSAQSDKVHGLQHWPSNTEVLDLYFSKTEQKLLKQNSAYTCVKTACGLTRNNYFKVMASSSLEQWQTNGWLDSTAPEGWFEKYTQLVQLGKAHNWLLELKRYNSFAARHAGQLLANPAQARQKQRQGLLNWSSPLAFVA